MNLTQEKKNKLAAISLFAASFFLPFGYDALFKLIMEWTGSYWIADIIFYCISAAFFGLYFYFSGINPFSEIRDIFLNVYENKIKHYGKRKKS
jgi:hypothetical protein